MESTSNLNNAKYQRIKRYLMEMATDIQINPEFIDRFAYNYANRGQWVSSEWIYQWFCLTGKTTRYNDFCSYYILRLKSSEIRLLHTQTFSMDKSGRMKNELGQVIQKLYEVSQRGIKSIMMQADEKTREYYIELEELMFDYLDKKEEENKALQIYIEENKEDHVIYEHAVVGENRRYRGITNDIKTRNSSHRRNSCNPHLRKAVEDGKQIETTILKRFRSLSRNECKQIERDSILEIPIEERMNIRIPKPLRPQQQHMDNDLTTIGESMEQLTYQELNDVRWEQKYQACIDYKQQYGKLPVEYGQPREIQILARWITCMKQALANRNRYRITDNRRCKIEELIQDQISFDEQWNQNYQKCLQFKQQNNGFPKKGSSNKNEQILAVWLLDCKRFLSQGKYNDERVNKMKILLDGYQTKEFKWETQYEECVQIQREFNRFPNQSEKRLHQWLWDQRMFLKNNDTRITDERKAKLHILLNSIQVPTLQQRWLEQYNKCMDLFKTNQILNSQQKNWLRVQKKALEGVGYIDESRKAKIPELLELWAIYKQK